DRRQSPALRPAAADVGGHRLGRGDVPISSFEVGDRASGQDELVRGQDRVEGCERRPLTGPERLHPFVDVAAMPQNVGHAPQAAARLRTESSFVERRNFSSESPPVPRVRGEGGYRIDVDVDLVALRDNAGRYVHTQMLPTCEVSPDQ